MKTTRIMLQGAIFLLLTACNQKPETTLSETTPVKVTTTLVKTLNGQQTMSYSGTVIPFQSIPINFQTVGTVQSVKVDEGMSVYKGQILATLDQTDLLNMYKLSETKYNQALDAFNRLKEVYDKGSLVEIKWVEMESNLHQAEAALAISKNNLGKTILTAPENGIIGKRNIEPGMSSIGISAPFELVKIDQIYVRLSVPENEIAKVKQGSVATFTVPAIGTNLFSGEVTMVGVVADRFARTYEVKVLADNPGLVIKPGMVCDISLNSDQAPANVVDYRAVTHDVNGAFVYKVNTSKTAVTKQPVQTGQTTPDGIEIIAGLQPGDEVVCVGLNKISDNSKIEL
jgi:RND family efflux transporter MFP subunit